MTWLVSWLLKFYFLWPLAFLLFQVEKPPSLIWIDLFHYFKIGFIQSSLSLTVIMLGSAFVAFGLMSLRSGRWKRLLTIVFVLPAFVPSLFVIVSYQSILDLLGMSTYRGLWNIVAVHGLMNFGMGGVLLHEVLTRINWKASELAFLEGASVWRIYWQQLRSNSSQVRLVAFSLFILCFTSFAVPLALGGAYGGSLEILAYRSLLWQGDLSGALIVMLVQWMILFSLMKSFLQLPVRSSFVLRQNSLPLGQHWLWIVPLFINVWLISGMFNFNISLGWLKLEQFLGANPEVVSQWLNSVGIGLVTGVLIVGLFMIVAYSWSSPGLQNWILGFSSMSTVLTGLCFFLIPWSSWLKISVGLSLLFFPVVFRMLGAATLNGLREQCHVAALMGAKPWDIFMSILFPQCIGTAFWMGGVVAFWAVGDFAFSSMAAGDLSNLALLTLSFFSSYQSDLAVILSWFLLASGAGLFWLFNWGSNVCRRKYKV